MIELKNFQRETVEELNDYVSDLLNKSRGRKICIFRSPMGSGKTIMMANAIKLINSGEKEFELCFMWLSIGTGELLEQSFNKVNSMIGKKLKCIYFEDKLKGTSTIKGGEVLFINWEKINSETNVMRRAGDYPNIFDLMNSKDKKTKIVLIIDESHRSANTERADMVRKTLSPDITIEMSATPVIKITDTELHNQTCHYISVDPSEVIKSELIKKEIIINKDIDTVQADNFTGIGIVLEAAYNKRLELLEILLKENRNVNPLVLIQIPNADRGQDRIEFIEAFLEERGITYENGKLAKMLSGDHIHIDHIKEIDNKVEFLIFKQAIAVGWDCPRAYILAKFRDFGNDIFEIQTVGRILRMAEAFHYKNGILNIGYVYTTINDIQIDTGKSYYTALIKHLKADLNTKDFPGLKSFHKQRFHSNDVLSDFGQKLAEIWTKELKLKKRGKDFLYTDVLKGFEEFGFHVDGRDIKTTLLSDVLIDIPGAIDDITGKYSEYAEGELSVVFSELSLTLKFNKIITNNLTEFTTRRSLPVVSAAISHFFAQTLGTYYRDAGKKSYVKRVLLSKPSLFNQLLHKTIEAYRPERLKKATIKSEKNSGEESPIWSLEKELYYAPVHEQVEHKLYVYKPCYLKEKRNNLEKDFEDYIDSKQNLITWWYKNEDNGKENFAIKYVENNKVRAFYPDYIVQMTNGNIGIFDTKGGLTAKTATEKAEALIKYTQNHFNITGGIVVKHKGSWLVHRADKYRYDGINFDGWETIDSVLSKDKVLNLI